MTPEDRQTLWSNLPDAHKRIEGGARLVLVKREAPERVWVPLRDLTMAEFCYLRSFAWAQEWKRKREVKDRVDRERAQKR